MITSTPPFAAQKNGQPVTSIRLLTEPQVVAIITRQTHAISEFVQGGGRTWFISVLKGAEEPTKLVRVILERTYSNLAARIQWTTIRMQGGGLNRPARVLAYSPDRNEWDLHHDLFLVFDEMTDKGDTALTAIHQAAVPATASFCYLFKRQGGALPNAPVSLGNPWVIEPVVFADDSPEPQPPFIVGVGTNLSVSAEDDGDELRQLRELWAVPWGSTLVRPVPSPV